jgi:hypothetical protein
MASGECKQQKAADNQLTFLLVALIKRVRFLLTAIHESTALRHDAELLVQDLAIKEFLLVECHNSVQASWSHQKRHNNNINFHFISSSTRARDPEEKTLFLLARLRSRHLRLTF